MPSGRILIYLNDTVVILFNKVSNVGAKYIDCLPQIGMELVAHCHATHILNCNS